jgi:hypothetical protein
MRIITSSRLAIHATRLAQLRFLEKDIISVFTPDQLQRTPFILRMIDDQGQFVAAERMASRVLAALEKVLGPNHISTIGCVNNLGTVYRDLDKV